MPTTPKNQWPTPNEHEDPFFESFQALVEAQDSSVFAAKENTETVLSGGGVVSWDAGSGELTWAATIEIPATMAGFLWQLPAGDATIPDGSVLYVSLTHPPVSNVTLAAAVGSQLPVGDPYFLIAIRRGTSVYFRNGAVLKDGQSVALFTGGTAFGSVGQKLRNNIFMAQNERTDQSLYTVVGNFSLNPLDYALSSATTTIKFVATGFVSDGALTGNVQLHNLTDVSLEATLMFAGTTTVGKLLSANLTLPGSAKMYEVRINVTGGTPPDDQLVVMGAGFEIDNTF